MESTMAVSILQGNSLQSVEQVAARKAWLGKLYSAFIAARQKQADMRLAHLATQHSAVAKADRARAELRKYSIG
jgi:hypothetical protein